MDELTACIIPGAGQSRRMESKLNKQYLRLLKIPILAHTWRVFARLSFIKELILVVNEEEKELCYTETVKPFINDGEIEKNCQIKIISGGRNRQGSVFNGLCEVSDEVSYVIVHDGARPLVEQDLILKTVKSAFEYSAAIAAVPVKDTIKFVNENGFVVETPSRDKLWAVQTPQVFKKDILMRAHEKAKKDGFIGFDDSSLVERIGIYPRVVKSSYENLKITTREDIEIAEKILKEREA